MLCAENLCPLFYHDHNQPTKGKNDKMIQCHDISSTKNIGWQIQLSPWTKLGSVRSPNSHEHNLDIHRDFNYKQTPNYPTTHVGCITASSFFFLSNKWSVSAMLSLQNLLPAVMLPGGHAGIWNLQHTHALTFLRSCTVTFSRSLRGSWTSVVLHRRVQPEGSCVLLELGVQIQSVYVLRLQAGVALSQEQW